MTDDDDDNPDGAPPSADGALAERLTAVLKDALPSRNGDVVFECITGKLADHAWGGAGLYMTLRMLIWEEEQIRDAKEQDVLFATRSELADEARVAHSLRAWARVMGEVLAGSTYDGFETMMPHDFVHTKILELKRAHTEDDFVKALRERSRLGRWIMPKHPALNVERITEIFRQLLPARGERASMELVEVVVEREAFSVVLRFITWDVTGETMSIRNVKEQQVYYGLLRVEETRLRAFLAAWCEVLGEVFDAMSDDALDTLMPHDLACRDAFAIASAETKDDFVKALKQRSRLGRYLAKPAAPTTPTHDGEL